jgi:hypothetical protein
MLRNPLLTGDILSIPSRNQIGLPVTAKKTEVTIFAIGPAGRLEKKSGNPHEVCNGKGIPISGFLVISPVQRAG